MNGTTRYQVEEALDAAMRVIIENYKRTDLWRLTDTFIAALDKQGYTIMPKPELPVKLVPKE